MPARDRPRYAARMQLLAGQVVIYYLFDVAEAVDLAAVPPLVGGAASAARLAPKPATPASVQYDNPPLVFDGEAVGIDRVAGLAARCRIYDYGVLSMALSRPFDGTWADLVALGPSVIENAALQRDAEQACRQVVARLRPSLAGVRDTVLWEDYVVFQVHDADRTAPRPAHELMAREGDAIASLLRGERQALSQQERDTVLRHQLSYLPDDLVVPTWNAALVYDTAAGARGALEILEFANSQLLQFRYYDQRLDRELEGIYTSLPRPRWIDQWVGSRYARAARRVHALVIDVTGVTDRTVNALKFTGDVYAARLFALVADRLGLGAWKADVEGKLRTLDAIYRFAVEQSSMARGQLLELLVVLILVFELAMLLAGLLS